MLPLYDIHNITFFLNASINFRSSLNPDFVQANLLIKNFDYSVDFVLILLCIKDPGPVGILLDSQDMFSIIFGR